MYQDYIRERENKEVMHHEHGFAIYGYNCVPGVDFPHVYLQDVYVRPEHRKKGIARILSNQVAAQAKASGVKIMLSSVDVTAKNSHESLLTMISHGFKLYSADNSMIWFVKEI